MKTSKISDYNNFNGKNPESWARDVNTDLNNIFLCLSSRIRFGANNTATNMGENIDGQFVNYTTNATPDTEDTIAHNLGTVPKGYIVMSKSKAGDIYQQATTGTLWTVSNIYLKCTVSSVSVTLFLLH
jgi:hypothetical protein